MALDFATLPENVKAPYTADQVLSNYVYVFYVSFVVAFIFTPIMRIVATHYGIVDKPDARKMHNRPVAYLGGVAVFLGWIAGLALSQSIYLHRSVGEAVTLKLHFSIVLGAIVIVVLGLLDDIFHINPYAKIVGQVLAAMALLWDGVGTRMAVPLFQPINARVALYFHWPPVPDWAMVAVSCAMVVALVVFCCNATNLIDGLDGLCGGVTGIITTGFLFLVTNMAMNGSLETMNEDAMRIVLALALLGGVLGFVPFNFNPASIFMGDTGSMFLGFAIAVLIAMMAEVHARWFLAAGVMFALPVMDTSLAFARRYVNGRPLFSADKFHFHHQLVARGLTVRRAVVVLYAFAIILVCLGASIVYIRTRYSAGMYLVIFAYILVAAYKMGMVHEKPVTQKAEASKAVVGSRSDGAAGRSV